MTGSHAHRRRVVAGAGAALALFGASLAAAMPLRHVPRYRYYALYRTDPGAHRLIGTIEYTWEHRESFLFEVVLETRNGRQYPFDRGLAGAAMPHVAAAGHSTPGCHTAVACGDARSGTMPIHVNIPVWFDYVFATRDAVVTVDLSRSPDKHWAFKEITGDARVTGRLHGVLPGDGDGTSVGAVGFEVQRVGDISHPGGRYGSVAIATVPVDPTPGYGSTGSARLDGEQAYTEGDGRLNGRMWHATGWNLGPTEWRLHGDLTAVGYGGGPTLVVYDLPDPKAMRTLFRGRG